MVQKNGFKRYLARLDIKPRRGTTPKSVSATTLLRRVRQFGGGHSAASSCIRDEAPETQNTIQIGFKKKA